MALVLADRVQETTTTTGTGSLTLAGAVSGFQSFATVGNANTCYYTIVDGTTWEVGIGTYATAGPTLARTTVLSNSSGNTSPITLSAGSKSVFLTYPAEKSVNLNADGNVEILTYVPDTVTTIGTLNVGDGTYNISQAGQIATFAGADDVVNGINVQNTSTSNTAYSAIQVGADTFSTGYYLQIGTNSSTYDYAAAGYPNSSINQPNTHYILANKADLGIATWDADDIHFIQNASTATVDSMTLYADGGVSLGGLANPGLGNIACNNINLKFQQIATTGGTTVLNNASPYYTQFTGTNTQTLQLPDATTCLLGTTLIFDNDSTQNVDIADGAGTVFELLVPGGFHTFVLENNSTVAGTWLRYSQVPSAVEWGTLSLSLGATVISGGTWQGGTIAGGYGGTGLTSFVGANNALYSTGATTLTAGTLPVAAGGTGITSLTANYIPVGNGTSGFTSSSALQFASGVLVVGGTAVLGGATNPITAFTGTTNNYIQTYVYNASTGISASSDFVAYTNNSTDAHGFADLGYTSSTYADPVYTVTGPNEAYVFGSALNSSTTGNLVYATDSTGSANAHQWYVGGFTQLKSAWKMQLTSTGLQLANALAVTSGGTGVTTSTGSGANALATSPTLVTPILGTPTSGNLANCTFPTLNQNTTGTAANVTGTVAIINGGTGATTAPLALTALGAYPATNPSGFTSNTGTVTSITAGTGLSGGAITTSGTIALANTAVTAGSYTTANITVDAQGRLTAAASGTGGVTSVTGTAPIVSSGGATPAISLANTTVTAGAYTSANITVDAQGRLTAAASGTGSNGGATEVSSAVNITLTAASTRVQAITMTASGNSVTLPNATTLTTGGVLFAIKNTGLNTFLVRNTSGLLLAPVAAGQIVALYLTNNSTSAGTWAAANGSASSFLAPMFAGDVLTVNAVSSTYVSVTALSATQAIVTYSGVSNFLNTCTLNISGATITAGTVLAVNAVASFFTSVTALSATQAIVVYRGTGTFSQACTLNISGTTVTAGAAITINSVLVNSLSVTALSATQAVVAYQGASNFLNTCTLNISGTTVTAGANLVTNAVSSTYISASKLSATQAIVTYLGASNFLNARTLSISGTTVTAGANLVVNGVASTYATVAGLSATQAIVTYSGVSSFLSACTLNISGTTVTAGTVLVVSGVAGTYIGTSKLSATQAIVVYVASGTLQTCILNSNGTAVVAGPVLIVPQTTASAWGAVAALSATQAIAAYQDAGTFLKTVSLEPIG